MKIFVLEKTETRTTQENRQYAIKPQMIKNYLSSLCLKMDRQIKNLCQQVARHYRILNERRISQYSTVYYKTYLISVFPPKSFAWGKSDTIDAQIYITRPGHST